MTVEIIVHLKSGGNSSLTVFDTSLAEQASVYSKFFDDKRGATVLSHLTTSSQCFIPKDNIAFVEINEVAQ